MRTSRVLLVIAATLLISNAAARGKEAEKVATPKKEQGNVDVKPIDSVTVAIIDFESKAPGNPDLGRQLGDILTARLSIYDQFRLVERKKLQELLKEQQLNLSGMVETSQATKVGKMLGARIMIFGRAFVVDRDLYLVAKIVGTETTLVKGVIAKGKLESNLSDTIDQLVDKLAVGLEKWSPQLLPKSQKLQKKIDTLKQRLKGKDLPTVAITISEVHINRRVVDPAGQTEVRKVFQAVGFEIIEPKGPKAIGAELLVTGKGFSEFGARVGGLTSCLARLEVEVKYKIGRKVIASERATRRAVDLSEAIAGKTALQAAGHQLAIRIIQRIAEDIEKNEQ